MASMTAKGFQMRSARDYALAVGSIAVALGAALLMDSFGVRELPAVLFLLAISMVAWYTGPRPATLAIVLAGLAMVYFFVEPRYSLGITKAELPFFGLFIAFGALITAFSTIRHRVERQLLQSRDELAKEVAERTQQASLLNLTHDSIFVRDMDDVITYWNRGAEELFGWAPDQAIGKHAHELLKSEFPIPLGVIHAELLRNDRWDGEIQKTRADGTAVVVASRWSLQRDSGGQPVARLATANDIGDRKRREEEVRHLNDELARRSIELEASNKELEAFAYSVSHDLRAPLRHMSGFTELLQGHSATRLDDKS